MANTVAKLIVIPAPGLGHIMSTVEIAKLLVNRDQRVSITVLVIKPKSEGSGSAITTYIESLANNAMDRISFIELPQDETLPLFESKSKSPMISFTEFIKNQTKYVRDVVGDMMNQPCSGQVVGFVIDVLCPSLMDVADEFEIPTYVFSTSNAAYLGFKLYLQTLSDDQGQDVIEMMNSDTRISVPSFVKPVPTSAFPSLMRTKEGLDFTLWSIRKLRKVKAILVNTFLELETHAIQSLSADVSVPFVYVVGPILNLEGGGAKKSDDDVISWLDNQPPSSVVFLCFGSMGSFEETQVKEIAYALENSGSRFVWSLRRPPSKERRTIDTGDYEDPGTVLPEGFLERTDGRGKVIGWAPQVTLLAHPAVGGFVSHCGWNSLLESLWFGVPIATWPMYAEQQMNAFEMVEELGLAVKIKLDYKKDIFNHKDGTVIVTAEEIKCGIRELMGDNEVRMKVKEMSEKSRAAVAEGGSSYASVGKFIRDITRNVS
ncbi:anthocyanidin 3-O-glucosyltransferase 2-like [Rutidosis leptorrhynchoides]|uniref:anthocyanidin 3-O-glucosyltransferase 2-like n=1 Tax=Rutidosis leptorrhynchoides TaxID=125765 RepID=UPI003A9A2356